MPSPKRIPAPRSLPPRALPALAAILALAAQPAPGQAKAAAPAKNAAAAVAAFAKVADQAEPVRQAKLSDLSRFAAPEVTRLLLAELGRARTESYRSAVVGAIGRQQRDGVLPALLELLDDRDSPFSRNFVLATAIGRQGDAAVPELARRLRALGSAAPGKRGNVGSTGKGKGSAPSPASIVSQMRGALLRGLGTAATPAAFAVLMQAAAEGTDYERYTALQNLAKAPPTPQLTNLRLAALESRHDPQRFEALDQLIAAGHPDVQGRALSIYADLRKRPVASTYGARLVGAFATLLRTAPGEAVFDGFLGAAGLAYTSASKTLDTVAGKVDGYPGLTAWLLDKGMQRKEPAERLAALRLLTGSRDPAVSALLQKVAAGRDAGMAGLALRALGQRGDQAALPVLRKAMRSRDPARRFAATLALHGLSKDQPAWRDELRSALRATDPQQRVLAMDLLAELQVLEALPEVHGSFAHKDWTVRAAAYDFCRIVRSLDSVDPLIARIDEERGRLREDVLDALKAITSYRLPTAARWRSWWDGSKGKFVMPPLKQAVPERRPRAAASTVSFFDIPLVSDRVVFVLDTSGSMSAAMGQISGGTTAGGGKPAAGGNTRIAEARRQLSRVVTALDKNASFNLIYFESRVNAFRKKVGKATKQTKSEALASVAKLAATGGTNIHDALELAFEDPSIDTIYLLSDGAPSAGKITDPEALADEVARWNRARRIRIHTISIGSQSRLMERLAKESGGVYSQVK